MGSGALDDGVEDDGGASTSARADGRPVPASDGDVAPRTLGNTIIDAQAKVIELAVPGRPLVERVLKASPMRLLGRTSHCYTSGHAFVGRVMASIRNGCEVLGVVSERPYVGIRFFAALRTTVCEASAPF